MSPEAEAAIINMEDTSGNFSRLGTVVDHSTVTITTSRERDSVGLINLESESVGLITDARIAAECQIGNILVDMCCINDSVEQ